MPAPPLVDSIAHTNVLSTIQQVAQSLTVAVTAVDALAKSEPVKLLIRARALHAVKAGVPWVVVPLIGAGLAYWGVRAWRRRPVETDVPIEHAH